MFRGHDGEELWLGRFSHNVSFRAELMKQGLGSGASSLSCKFATCWVRKVISMSLQCFLFSLTGWGVDVPISLWSRWSCCGYYTQRIDSCFGQMGKQVGPHIESVALTYHEFCPGVLVSQSSALCIYLMCIGCVTNSFCEFSVAHHCQGLKVLSNRTYGLWVNVKDGA